jgi:hypothetical protein
MVDAAWPAGSTVKTWPYLFSKYRASFARRPASAAALGDHSGPTRLGRAVELVQVALHQPIHRCTGPWMTAFVHLTDQTVLDLADLRRLLGARRHDVIEVMATLRDRVDPRLHANSHRTLANCSTLPRSRVLAAMGRTYIGFRATNRATRPD